jgi:hypothetical protein
MLGSGQYHLAVAGGYVVGPVTKSDVGIGHSLYHLAVAGEYVVGQLPSRTSGLDTVGTTSR